MKPPELSPEQLEVIELLRTPKLSLKDMPKGQKVRIRRVLDELHTRKGVSLSDIALLIGNKTSGYASWVARQVGVQPRGFEEARLKAIREKRRKYERKPFDGTDEDRAYLLGLRHGDLSVSRPWRGVVRVSTSTTHPAMSELFHGLFSPYGHVYQHPRYKKDTRSYEWNLCAFVDSSFEFLFEPAETFLSEIRQNKRLVLGYLSGLLDAEGSIIITRNSRAKVEVFIDYYNTNLGLLKVVERILKSLGYQCSLRINKKKGVKTRKYGIIHRKDYWQLSTYGMNKIQHLLMALHPKHGEKIRRRSLALSVRPEEDFDEVASEVEGLRNAIKKEVLEYIRACERRYLETHPAGLVEILPESRAALS